MKVRLRTAAVCLAALWAFPMAAQPTNMPVFDAADVRVSAPDSNDTFGGLRSGRLELKGATMLQLIMLANGMRYHVEDEQVMGGPKWLDTAKFDIVASSPANTSRESLRGMLQAMLVERFGLVMHQDQKPLPVYVLTVGKSLKLKESAPETQTSCDSNRDNNLITYTCRGLTIGAMAEAIRQAAGAYFDRQLVDRTGLKGQYDFTLKWTPKGLLGLPARDGDTGPAGGISVFDALDKQLGLKAEKVMEPGTVFVVDRVNEKPTDNPPGTLEKLPPQPTEFEVAEIKPSKVTNGDFNIRNGRLEATGVSLKDLITMSYGIDDDLLFGGEKWLETERFDVVAKTAANTSFETIRTMLRTLMEQRFKLAVHKEEKPSSAFLLTMPKKTSKLKESTSDARGMCKITAENGLRTYRCTNTTMAQFAEKLRQIAGGYVDHPVVDQTGLTGSYDFAVTWTGVGRVRALAQNAEGGAAGATPSAADPSTSLTVFEAIDRQLGLKLTAGKHLLPVLVLDHVERTPL